MWIILLFVILAVLGYFMIKAVRCGELNFRETSIFGIVSIGLAVFLIMVIVKLS
jgi:hypothetical protein